MIHLLDQESQVHCLILLWVIDLVSAHGRPYVTQVCSWQDDCCVGPLKYWWFLVTLSATYSNRPKPHYKPLWVLLLKSLTVSLRWVQRLRKLLLSQVISLRLFQRISDWSDTSSEATLQIRMDKSVMHSLPVKKWFTYGQGYKCPVQRCTWLPFLTALLNESSLSHKINIKSWEYTLYHEPLLMALPSAAIFPHCFTDFWPKTVTTDRLSLLHREFMYSLLQLVLFFLGPFT